MQNEVFAIDISFPTSIIDNIHWAIYIEWSFDAKDEIVNIVREKQ